MIIKSKIRGGFRGAANYLKAIGKNELMHVVEISDLDAKDLGEAFHNMWATACNSKAKKPLHHISINPFKDERLTDEQVKKIVERCEEKFGYKHGDHQRVIVEHVLDGRQHFHVMWCRVSQETGKAVWPGKDWIKAKEAAREMEKELGLKTPVPRSGKKHTDGHAIGSRATFRPSSISSPFLPLPLPKVRPEPRQTEQQPMRPMSGPARDEGMLSRMSEAQRIDFIAACEGRMTWRVYFERWGLAGLTL